jgi:S-adenosylmethionine:tRNA ribosyltransferase-isomerase
MKLQDFDFELPPGRIAQVPLKDRDQSRLLVVNRATGQTHHRHFRDLTTLLEAGDLLVVNDSRVIHARLLGRKAGSGGKVELLLVRPLSPVRAAEALAQPAGASDWVCLGQASKGLRRKEIVLISPDLSAEITSVMGEGEYGVRLRSSSDASLGERLDQVGRVPLPPYIEREATAEDGARYQTVYANEPGSVAAPTAGLHFTPELLESLSRIGVRRTTLTLEVGPGTFQPVRTEEIEAHRMHPERYFIPSDTAQAVAEAKRMRKRVVAVGTTVVRALEASTEPKTGEVRQGWHETSLFIRPGFTFRQADALLTNFHLPRSTLLILVSAFAGLQRILSAYREAVANGYRFFSYGDAMLIL